MKAVIKLHLKENIKKNSFIIFAVLGSIVTLVVLSQMQFTVNGVQATSDYAIYGIQWRILSLMASLAGVALSMNVISNHKEGSKRELLKLHGLPVYKQYLSLISGNLIVTSIMALILCTGLFIQILIKGGNMTVSGILAGVFFYLLTITCATLFVSLFTLIFPPVEDVLLEILAIALGSLRGTLHLIVGNMGGLFGTVTSFFLKLIPPLDAFGQLTRDFFMDSFSDYRTLFSCLFYLWALTGISYFLTRVVTRNED